MKPRLAFGDTVRFQALKEDRGPYFVEYHVPNENYQFACLFLVFPQKTSAEDAAKAMDAELERWARRYPVPILVTAFDNEERVINLRPTKPEDHLMGWISSSGQLEVHWRALPNEEIPCKPFTYARLLETYKDIPYTVSTADDKRRTITRTIRQNRFLLFLVIVYLVVIPVAIAILGHTNPIVSWATTIVSVLMGLVKLVELLGWKKPSKRRREKDAEELRIKHQDYYCQRNPEGFARLKAEVLNREFHERIQHEGEELKRAKQ